MAELRCGVDSCAYNQDKYCCKGDIMVGERNSCCPDETCCESFRTKGGDAYTSSIHHPSRTISIDCEAVKCKYNSNYRCVATQVNIDGAGAKKSSDTCCGTFTESK